MLPLVKMAKCVMLMGVHRWLTLARSSTHHSDWSNRSCWFVLQLPRRRRTFTQGDTVLTRLWLAPFPCSLLVFALPIIDTVLFTFGWKGGEDVIGFYFLHLHAVYVQPCLQVLIERRDCSENTWIVCVGFLWWLDNSSSHEVVTDHDPNALFTILFGS